MRLPVIPARHIGAAEIGSRIVATDGQLLPSG